jgi:thioredoxin 1
MNTTRRGDEMATVELTADAFEETVTSSGITLVDFWADWCGPCKSFSPIYDAASEKNPDIRFGKVDTEAEQALSAAAGITSIPTLMAFRDGILVFSQPGALPAPALDQVIAAVKGLDMDEVRAQISAQDQGQSRVESA